jgi:hypothetical protein
MFSSPISDAGSLFLLQLASIPNRKDTCPLFSRRYFPTLYRAAAANEKREAVSGKP